MKTQALFLGLVVSLVAPSLAHADAKTVATKLKNYGMPDLSIVGHRGAPFYAPEETTPSFVLAAEMGADYLEGDLSLTKDGVLILMHDDDLKRTTNVEAVFPKKKDKPISEFTWAEIQKLDAGTSYNELLYGGGMSKHTPRDYFKGAKVLRLEQLMAIARSLPGRTPGIYLEAKSRKDFPEEAVEVAARTVEVLKAHGWITGKNDGSRVILQTFVPEAVKKFKELAPSVPVTYLVGPTNTKNQVRKHIQIAQKMGADIIGPYILGALFDSKEKEFIDLFHAANLGIHPWIIDDVYKKVGPWMTQPRDGKKWAKSLVTMGVNGFFSDQPQYGVELFKPTRVLPNYDLDTLVDFHVRRLTEKLNPFLNAAIFKDVDVKPYEFKLHLAKMRK